MEKNKKRAYSVWSAMKRRCYNPNEKYYMSYGGTGVTVSEEWLSFNTFFKWYMENYYEIKGECMNLDKDILSNDCNIYSKDTCLIVPLRINNMFIHKVTGDMRGLQQVGKRYQVKVRNPFTGKNDYCGTYNTVTSASQAYQECKKILIKQMVFEYGDKLPTKVRTAVLNHKF